MSDLFLGVEQKQQEECDCQTTAASAALTHSYASFPLSYPTFQGGMDGGKVLTPASILALSPLRMVLDPAHGGEPWLRRHREDSWRWRTSPHDNIVFDEQRPPENEGMNVHHHCYQVRQGARGCWCPRSGTRGECEVPAAPRPAGPQGSPCPCTHPAWGTRLTGGASPGPPSPPRREGLCLLRPGASGR